MKPHWLNVTTRRGEILIQYVDADSLHDELRRLYRDRRISRGTMAALVDAYRHAGLDEHSIRQWTITHRHRTAKSLGWIPKRARVFVSDDKRHVLILLPPNSIEVLDRSEVA